MKYGFFGLMILGLFVCSLERVAAFNIEISPNEQQCFFEFLKKDQKVAITYQVIEGEPLEIDFWVSDPQNSILHMSPHKGTEHYEFKPHGPGKYTYCFSNQLSRTGYKMVQFSISGVDHAAVDPHAVMDPVLRAAQDLADDLHDIKEGQQFLIAREKLHRDTSESTNGRVTYWSIFQTLMLVGVCLFQIYYLKHFFEVKRVL